MSEQLKQNVSSAPTKNDQDVISLIKKMQEQLAVLERKIDSLIQKPQERSFQPRPYQERPYQEKRFQKPYRSFGNSSRPGGREGYDSKPREGYGGKPREGYAGKPREGGLSSGRPYKKHEGEESRGFGNKKKPFYQKHKAR